MVAGNFKMRRAAIKCELMGMRAKQNQLNDELASLILKRHDLLQEDAELQMAGTEFRRQMNIVAPRCPDCEGFTQWELDDANYLCFNPNCKRDKPVEVLNGL